MTKRKAKAGSSKARRRNLDELIAEATVDCYGIEEEFLGISMAAEENVECPFTAKVIGESVVVETLTTSDSIAFGVRAICRHKSKRYSIDLTSLEFSDPLPVGFEWIEAYLEWLSNSL